MHLPLTMLSAAGIELRLGDSTKEQDCYLRAHNLASQAVEKYKAIMEGQKQAVRRKQQPRGWWLRLFEEEGNPKVRCCSDLAEPTRPADSCVHTSHYSEEQASLAWNQSHGLSCKIPAQAPKF